MKETFLVIALLLLSTCPTFSQQGRQFKMDRSLDNPSIYNEWKTFDLNKRSPIKKFFNNPSDSTDYIWPGIYYKNKIRPLSIISDSTFHSNMIVVKPQGNYPSRIFTPDSTVNFTMRIYVPK